MSLRTEMPLTASQQNTHIIQSLTALGNLSTNDLASMRKVCRLWQTIVDDFLLNTVNVNDLKSLSTEEATLVYAATICYFFKKDQRVPEKEESAIIYEEGRFQRIFHIWEHFRFGPKEKVEALLIDLPKTNSLPTPKKKPENLTILNQQLLEASKNGDLAKVVQLLRDGADPNTQAPLVKRTPLHIAIEKGNIKIAIALFGARNIQINAQDIMKETPLFLAIKENHPPCFLLLINKGADINLPNKNNYTPLMIAAKLGKVNFLAVLIQKKADLELRDSQTFSSALMWATRKSDLYSLTILLGNKAYLETRDKDALTPLMIAAQNGDGNGVQIFCKAGSFLDAQDNEGNTALMWVAKSQKNTKFLTAWFILSQADLFLCNKKGKNILGVAIEEENKTLLAMLFDFLPPEILISLLAQENSHEKRNGLMQAVVTGRLSLLNIFVQKNLLPLSFYEAKDFEGKTAEELAPTKEVSDWVLANKALSQQHEELNRLHMFLERKKFDISYKNLCCVFLEISKSELQISDPDWLEKLHKNLVDQQTFNLPKENLLCLLVLTMEFKEDQLKAD